MQVVQKVIISLLILPIIGFSQSFYLGESNNGSGAGNLYSIDSTTCAVSTIGAMGTSVSGLATDASGNLFGSEALSGNVGGNNSLLSINTSTGVATAIGLLTDGVDQHTSVPDITFRGSTLYGWSEFNDTVITINTATGAVTDLGNGNNSAGSGLAANAAGTMYVIPCGGCGFTMGSADDSDLYTVDPGTGVLTYATDLIDNTTNGDVELGNTTIAAMTFDNAGNLWGFAGAFIGGGSSSSDLVSINTTTGELLTVCSGLPDGIDALSFAGVSTPAIIPATTNWFIAAIVMLFIGLGGLFGYRRFGQS
jgi:hypothetical protein